MFHHERMRCCEEEPYFGRGFGIGFRHGFGRGFGIGHGFIHRYLDDKTELEFAKKELELRLEYVSKELANHLDDLELNFMKREIENRISYIEGLIAKAEK